jgi:hypothetical protein
MVEGKIHTLLNWKTGNPASKVLGESPVSWLNIMILILRFWIKTVGEYEEASFALCENAK